MKCRADVVRVWREVVRRVRFLEEAYMRLVEEAYVCVDDYFCWTAMSLAPSPCSRLSVWSRWYSMTLLFLKY
jgi:hypothetical protein